MTPYKNFLIRGVLPPNEDEARRLKWKASYYVILDGKQFKRRLTTRLLHEGICNLHTRGGSLATKAVRAGYYWPTLRADALDFTRKCR